MDPEREYRSGEALPDESLAGFYEERNSEDVTVKIVVVNEQFPPSAPGGYFVPVLTKGDFLARAHERGD